MSREDMMVDVHGSGKLANKVALITGADSGIGREVALLFAREGADVAFVYFNKNNEAAMATVQDVNRLGQRCIAMQGDVGVEEFCKTCVENTVAALGRLDVLVNNAGTQRPRKSIMKLEAQDIERTFRTNIYGYIFMAKHAVRHMKPGATIVNTSSVTAYTGAEMLVDYSATKGAVVSFTRSLALQLAEQNIRVNGVAPGPIWTPLVPSTFPGTNPATFGTGTPMKRGGTPAEIAPCYLFLACADSAYMTGQMLHPNGGAIVNG